MTAPVLPPGALPVPFRPSFVSANAHVQTIAGKLLRPELALELRRERWPTDDEDFLDLDFMPDPDPTVPLILVLHGLEGSARRGYMLNTYRALAARGLSAVGLNFRACSGEPNQRARTYHSGETEDPAFVLRGLRARFPDRPLGAIGYSLGGNILLKLLGEEGDSSLIEAAVAVSVPYDLSAGATQLASGRMCRLYSEYFLRSLKGKVRDKSHLLTDLIEPGQLPSIASIREFDDRITAPLHGFDGAEDYYSRCSSAAFLTDIRRPTLLLHSADDPFLPLRAVPRAQMQENPWLHPTITARGGHVGFFHGPLTRPRFWAEESAARFMAVTLGPIFRGRRDSLHG